MLPVSENETLFLVLGTTYGGDGETTFALPDLRSRVPMHQGPSFTIGASGGAENVTLDVNQIPVHAHMLLATSNPASASSPSNNVLAEPASPDIYETAAAGGANLAPQSVGAVGGSQPHSNIQPVLAINFIMSLSGTFPQQ
jgi:microcystin-dependent protein